jgi:hypothetical protein
VLLTTDYWQPDRELRPFARFALHSNGAVVGFDEFLQRGQTQAGAAVAQAEEGFEDLLLHFLVYADAGIDEVE